MCPPLQDFFDSLKLYNELGINIFLAQYHWGRKCSFPCLGAALNAPLRLIGLNIKMILKGNEKRHTKPWMGIGCFLVSSETNINYLFSSSYKISNR